MSLKTYSSSDMVEHAHARSKERFSNLLLESIRRENELNSSLVYWKSKYHCLYSRHSDLLRYQFCDKCGSPPIKLDELCDERGGCTQETVQSLMSKLEEKEKEINHWKERFEKFKNNHVST